MDCRTCEQLAREELESALEEGREYEIELPCQGCVWHDFELHPENDLAIRVYSEISKPLVQDFPIARDYGWAILDLKLTKKEAKRVWNRLNQIHEFVRAKDGA